MSKNPLLRILYFLDSPVDRLGGAQINTLSLANSINDIYGAEVGIVSPRISGGVLQNMFPNIPRFYYSLPKPSLSSFLRKPLILYRGFIFAKKIINDFQPNIIHTQQPVSLLIIYLFLTISGRKKRLFLFCHTDHYLLQGYSFPLRMVNRLCQKKLDCLITTTTVNAEMWSGIDYDRKEIIPNYPSLFFEAFDSKKKNFCKEGSKTIIGFAGRMDQVKNWPLAEKIIFDLNKNRKDFNVHIAIATNQENNREVEETNSLRERLRNLLGDRLIFFNNLNQLDMAEFYYPIDIFILTSSFESFGRTAVEAMSRQCCVLGTNVGGIPEVIGDQDLICPEDSDCFIKKITSYMENRDLLKNKQLSLFNRFNNIFSSNRILEKQYLSYLRHLSEKS